MDVETKITGAVAVLERAKKLLVEAIFIHPENDYLEDTKTQINNAITILKTARYDRPNNKDCTNCSNSFILRSNRLICIEKQKNGKTVQESIVDEDGYCEEWN
ncbi:MAG: hypothetical protein LBC62_04475 [Treponema sp.]|jgi:hypothetical protein|nr:hypothetical protein [Treponema sp.]